MEDIYPNSIDEAINYSFGFKTNINDADEKKVCLATEYAIEQGIWISKEPESEGRCNWWLRPALWLNVAKSEKKMRQERNRK